MFNSILSYKPSEDKYYKGINSYDSFIIEGQFDGLVAEGYEVFLNLIRFLNKQHFVTQWIRKGNAIRREEFTFDKIELLELIEQNIYLLIEIVFFDKNRIQFKEYVVTHSALEMIKGYYNTSMIINNSQTLNLTVFGDADYLLFIVACIALRIENLDQIKRGIDFWDKQLSTSEIEL